MMECEVKRFRGRLELLNSLLYDYILNAVQTFASFSFAKIHIFIIHVGRAPSSVDLFIVRALRVINIL